jgi:hypothetical protein
LTAIAKVAVSDASADVSAAIAFRRRAVA